MASRFKVPAHVLAYSMALVPTVGYALYYQRNKPTVEEMEERLAPNYSSHIQSISEKRKSVVDMVHAMNRGQHEQELQQVLHGGKQAQKRQFPVNPTLYGTKEGVEKKQETEKEMEKKKKKQKRNALETSRDETRENATTKTTPALKDDGSGTSTTTGLIPVAVAVGSVAAVLGYIAGGRRS